MKTGSFLFLGTGASLGIPVVGCPCTVCHSESPCNRRLRPSGILNIDGKKILFDCGPDFRMQALYHHIESLDGLILTHAHHDHIAGIDELRVFYMRKKEALPCLLSQETLQEVQMRFPYIFADPHDREKITARLDLHVLEQRETNVRFLDIPFTYMSYEQMGMQVNGFRCGDFAYISDIHIYRDTIFTHLKGVKTLVLSALRMTPSLAHFSIDEAVAFAERAGVQHTWLTHIAHEVDHEEANGYLPPYVRMAYDGLEIPVSFEE
jgi:phosphoribosyl 1,2-cyclic phosphate phosphodiesterase